jgi:hypothetical protein
MGKMMMVEHKVARGWSSYVVTGVGIDAGDDGG